ELAHLEHRPHGPLRLFGIGVLQPLWQRGRYHLPGQSEFVLQPAALAFGAAVRELAPEVVDVRLSIAQDLERDCLGELEAGAAVKGEELEALDLEGDGHDRSRLLAVDFLALLSIAADLAELCVGEDRHIVLGGRFGLGIEPQAWLDALRYNWHAGSFLVFAWVGSCLVARRSAGRGSRPVAPASPPPPCPRRSPAPPDRGRRRSEIPRAG